MKNLGSKTFLISMLMILVVMPSYANSAANDQNLKEVIAKQGEKQPKVMGSGIYKDELIKTQDGWKISRRTLITD